MPETVDIAMFESSKRGRRRSVLFAIVVGTGFLTIAAGAGTIFQTGSTAIGAVLLSLGVGLPAFGFVIAAGKIDHVLFDDEIRIEESESA
jgi:hypothetical protein